MAIKNLFTNPRLQQREDKHGNDPDGCNALRLLIYLTDDELSPEEAARVEAHLRSCGSCQSIRQEVLNNRNTILKLFDDSPLNEEAFIPSIQLQKTAVDLKPTATARIISITRWISTIAAAFLLVLFITEQVSSVRKISRLETLAIAASYDQTPGLLDRWTLDRIPVTFETRQKLVLQAKAFRSIGGLFNSDRMRISDYIATLSAGSSYRISAENLIRGDRLIKQLENTQHKISIK